MSAIDLGKAPEQLLISQLRDYAHRLLVAQADAAEFHDLLRAYQKAQSENPDTEETIAIFREGQRALHELMHDLLPEGELEEWEDEKHAVGP